MSVFNFLKKKNGIPDKINNSPILCSESPKTINYDKKSIENADLNRLSSFYSKYYDLTVSVLTKNGIYPFPRSAEAIDIYGVPTKKVSTADTVSLLPLRSNERAIYAVECKGYTFALPDNGIGIRYLYLDKPEKNIEWLDNVDTKIRRSILSLCSDGEDLFFLREDGFIDSTAKSWSPLFAFDMVKERIELVSVFKKEDYYEEIEKRLQESREIEYGIFCVDEKNLFYDMNKKVFFLVYTEGSYSEGYDVSYGVVSKESALEELSAGYYGSIRLLNDECNRGKIPAFALINYLPENVGVSEYTPPTNVGYGYIYI